MKTRKKDNKNSLKWKIIAISLFNLFVLIPFELYTQQQWREKTQNIKTANNFVLSPSTLWYIVWWYLKPFTEPFFERHKINEQSAIKKIPQKFQGRTEKVWFIFHWCCNFSEHLFWIVMIDIMCGKCFQYCHIFFSIFLFDYNVLCNNNVEYEYIIIAGGATQYF